MRQNQHIDHTNSRVIEQTPVKQNAPPGGLNNVRDSRAQGSGSGGNYRTSDTSSAVSADSFFYFNLCSRVDDTNAEIIFIISSDGE